MFEKAITLARLYTDEVSFLRYRSPYRQSNRAAQNVKITKAPKMKQKKPADVDFIQIKEILPSK